MRVNKIKKKYLDVNVFCDNGQFNCGDQIAYEVEMDLRAMKEAIDYIDDFIKYKNPVKTFGDSSLLHAREILNKRITKFD